MYAQLCVLLVNCLTGCTAFALLGCIHVCTTLCFLGRLPDCMHSFCSASQLPDCVRSIVSCLLGGKSEQHAVLCGSAAGNPCKQACSAGARSVCAIECALHDVLCLAVQVWCKMRLLFVFLVGQQTNHVLTFTIYQTLTNFVHV